MQDKVYARIDKVYTREAPPNKDVERYRHREERA